MYAQRGPGAAKIGSYKKRLENARNWIIECVSDGVVYGMSYCVDSEKALFNEDDCQECELRV
jgi:hypothetical protein